MIAVGAAGLLHPRGCLFVEAACMKRIANDRRESQSLCDAVKTSCCVGVIYSARRGFCLWLMCVALELSPPAS